MTPQEKAEAKRRKEQLEFERKSAAERDARKLRDEMLSHIRNWGSYEDFQNAGGMKVKTLLAWEMTEVIPKTTSLLRCARILKLRLTWTK